MLRSQLDTHPRNEDGGFWHKKVYPNQMWLDGLYMGAPFYAEYAFRNNRVQDYKDIVNQFITVARHTYDPKNGLYCYACDVSRKGTFGHIPLPTLTNSREYDRSQTYNTG